jgi:hypothetical protein
VEVLSIVNGSIEALTFGCTMALPLLVAGSLVVNSISGEILGITFSLGVVALLLLFSVEEVVPTLPATGGSASTIICPVISRFTGGITLTSTFALPGEIALTLVFLSKLKNSP